MTTSIGPCVEHAISRSRQILGYGIDFEDVRGFAQQILAEGGWPTSHQRADVVDADQVRAGDLVLLRSMNGSGHLGVMLDSVRVEDLRDNGVCVFPIKRLRQLIVQVWRPRP